ncbi:MAG: T9SS type A sorting domain-containing protein [Bacteroidota bacterium]
MKKLKLTLLAFTIGSALNYSVGQTPTIEWQKSLGGSNSDYASTIIRTSDQGYIIAGYTSTNNDGDVTGWHAGIDTTMFIDEFDDTTYSFYNYGDFWIVKMDAVGNIEWQKCLGGIANESATSIEETSDGGFILGGYGSSTDGDGSTNQGLNDFWVMKIDNTGNKIWQKSYGGSSQDFANSIKETNDGGYIVAGSSKSNNGDVTGNQGEEDLWVLKLDNIGNLEWKKSLGGSHWDEVYAVQQTFDGGFILTGLTRSNEGDISGNHNPPIGGGSTYTANDVLLLKLSNIGVVEWQKCLGGTGGDYAKSIQQTIDNGYILAGSTSSTDGDVTGYHLGTQPANSDFWIVKLNDLGTIEWQKALGGTGRDEANSISQSSDKGFIVTGWTNSTDGDISSNNGSEDFWAVKLDSIGTFLWEKTLGGTSYDRANSVSETNNGGYILTGITQSSNGDITTPNRGSYDVWVVKLSNGTANLEDLENEVSISPNPTSGKIYLKNLSQKVDFQVFDIYGKLVCEYKNLSSNSIDLSSLANGIYHLSIYDKENNTLNTERILLNK